MAVRVGINGFGRIGRQVFKAMRDNYAGVLEVVAFNDIGDLKTMAHLLKYDSNYGRFDGTVTVGGEDTLMIDGFPVKVFKETDPGKLPWGGSGRRYRRGIHRSLHHQEGWRQQEGQGRPGRREPHHQGRGEEGDHLLAGRGRRSDYRHGRERGQVRQRRTPRPVQRLLHHQLSGAGGQSRERQLQDRARPHDHGPCLHQ